MTEAKAYEGSKAFKDLEDEASLTLFSLGVLAKGGDGSLSIKEGIDEGPIGTAGGMLVGSLVGLLGGPTGVVLGATGGALLGSIGGMSNAGVGVDFINAVDEKMEAGSFAVVAEVDEYSLTPVDTRMGKLGGTVFRRNRADFADQLFEQEIEALNAELDQLNAELQQAAAEDRAAIEAAIA